MSFEQVIKQFRDGQLSDDQLADRLDDWLEELAGVHKRIEARADDELADQALKELEECNELLNSLYDALEDQDRESFDELATPAAARLQETLATVAELRASLLPPAVQELFAQVDRLLDGDADLQDVLKKIDEIEVASRSIRERGLQPGPEAVQGLFLKAATNAEQGLEALRQGAQLGDADKVDLGKELLRAANATLVEAQL